jgi:hypothetical protein
MMPGPRYPLVGGSACPGSRPHRRAPPSAPSTSSALSHSLSLSLSAPLRLLHLERSHLGGTTTHPFSLAALSIHLHPLPPPKKTIAPLPSCHPCTGARLALSSPCAADLGLVPALVIVAQPQSDVEAACSIAAFPASVAPLPAFAILQTSGLLQAWLAPISSMPALVPLSHSAGGRLGASEVPVEPDPGAHAAWVMACRCVAWVLRGASGSRRMLPC